MHFKTREYLHPQIVSHGEWVFFKIATFKENCFFVLQIFTATTLITDFTKTSIKILKIILSKPNGHQSWSIWVKEESYQVVRLTLHTGDLHQSNKHQFNKCSSNFSYFLIKQIIKSYGYLTGSLEQVGMHESCHTFGSFFTEIKREMFFSIHHGWTTSWAQHCKKANQTKN